jgi:hypothetical protein
MPHDPFKVQFNPLEKNEVYVSAALKISNSAYCINGFRMILTINLDYFPEQR